LEVGIEKEIRANVYQFS